MRRPEHGTSDVLSPLFVCSVHREGTVAPSLKRSETPNTDWRSTKKKNPARRRKRNEEELLRWTHMAGPPQLPLLFFSVTTHKHASVGALRRKADCQSSPFRSFQLSCGGGCNSLCNDPPPLNCASDGTSKHAHVHKHTRFLSLSLTPSAKERKIERELAPRVFCVLCVREQKKRGGLGRGGRKSQSLSERRSRKDNHNGQEQKWE
jgi:hypothetical protein